MTKTGPSVPPIIHVYIGGLLANGKLKYESRSRGVSRWSPLHFSQSVIDRACGVHALLIAVALVTRAPRSAMERLSEATRGPWRAFFEVAKPLYFVGSTPKALQECAAQLDGVKTRRQRITSAEQLYRVCLAAIEAGEVPLLNLDGPRIAHWCVALGCEARGDKPSAVLALDPAGSEPWACFTNTRLELKPSAKSKALYSYRNHEGGLKLARVRNVLIVSGSPEETA